MTLNDLKKDILEDLHQQDWWVRQDNMYTTEIDECVSQAISKTSEETKKAITKLHFYNLEEHEKHIAYMAKDQIEDNFKEWNQ